MEEIDQPRWQPDFSNKSTVKFIARIGPVDVWQDEEDSTLEFMFMWGYGKDGNDDEGYGWISNSMPMRLADDLQLTTEEKDRWQMMHRLLTRHPR